MKRSSNSRGFALPMAIFVIAFATMSIAAAFTIVSSERRVLDNTAAQTDALELAQSGLNQYLINRRTLGFTTSPPAASESTRVTLTGGYVDVVAKQIRPSIGNAPAMYVVRAKGTSTAPTYSKTPLGQRQVASYAKWQPGNMKVRGGWMSLTGLLKNGTAGSLSGIDGCGQAPTVAGVSVPEPPGFDATGNFTPTGSPAVEDLGAPHDAVDSIHVDWENIRTGQAFAADITIPGGAWPSFADPNYWPTILVNGDFSLPGSGRGTLIVTGNLTISGSATWNGIVMVGEKMTSNGNNSVLGATMTGLDVLLAGNPDVAASEIGQDATGNGNKTFQYNSCNVKNALQRFGSLQVFRNAWMDNWSSY